LFFVFCFFVQACISRYTVLFIEHLVAFCLVSFAGMNELVSRVPQEIGREEIILESQIGAGSFAVVHKARCRGTVVAVKQAKSSFFHGLTQEQIKAFQHEVLVLSKLGFVTMLLMVRFLFMIFFQRPAHPNLLLFMGVCVTDKELLIVTEFLNEGNLEDKVLSAADISLFSRMRYVLWFCLLV
jgi:serine/threonine protein kinase